MSLAAKGWVRPEAGPFENGNLMISLVVPTYNERANIHELVDRTGIALGACSSKYELIIVDDASHDGTAAEIRRLQEGRPWLKLLERQNERDLSTAVVAGWRVAEGDIVGCMDADLQHPPELLPMLFQRLQKTGAAITVASRHVAGGGVSQWNLVRRFISWTATLMATFVLPGTLGKVRDPMSGFFLVRRPVLEGAALNPVGYKILLEVLAKGQYQGVEEVPFTFEERTKGGSKLGSSTIVKYLLHLLRLSLDTGEAWRTTKYALVGISGAIVNYAVLRWLLGGFALHTAVAAAGGAGTAIVNNFIWNEIFTFPEARRVEPGLARLVHRFTLFVLFSSSGLAINVLSILVLTGPLHVPLVPGVVAGIAIAAIWNFFTNSNVTWRAWWNRKLLASQGSPHQTADLAPVDGYGGENPEALVTVPCNICGSTRFEVLHDGDPRLMARKPAAVFRCTSEQHGDFTRIVRCLDCGLVYENPREPEKLIHDNYAQVVDETYEREKEGRIRTFSRLLDDLACFRKPGTLLEVGCYTGVFLDLARQRGWQVTGIEPSRWAAGLTRSKGLDVLNAPVGESNLPAESFDAVVMWDVIEHLHDPAGVVRSLSELVKPGGIFCLSTMDVGAVFAKLAGRRWPWFMRMHLYYFTPGTMTRMLKDAGFGVLAIERHKRIVSLRYFLGKMAASITPPLGKVADWIGKPFSKVYVTIDLGDIMNIFASKAVTAVEVPERTSAAHG